MNNVAIYHRSAAVRAYDKDKIFPAEEKLFAEFLKPGMRILDLGCGAGRTTGYLKNFDPNVHGADVSAAMIEKAKERFPEIQFSVMDAAQLGFADGMFDAIVFSFNGLDYLYPVDRRAAALAEIRRVLKPGGVFIFSSHNSQMLPLSRPRLKDFLFNVFTGRIFMRYRIDHQAYGPLTTYFGSIDRQVRELHAHGFQVLEMTSNKYQSGWRMRFLTSYVYYAARKR
ncbi:MAG TPA: class I SAM-dependent methyltransferase [Candidatus Paceibacterota bacterium]|nr:class I SAM-dependent methyltransferase [Candidatus Paceibacterota bacterium]